MTERQLITGVAAGIVVAFVALCWLTSAVSPLAPKADQGEGGNISWNPAGKVERQPFAAPGGLYHPDGAGDGRTGLINWGWEWIASPPGEAEVGLGYAG